MREKWRCRPAPSTTLLLLLPLPSPPTSAAGNNNLSATTQLQVKKQQQQHHGRWCDHQRFNLMRGTTSQALLLALLQMVAQALGCISSAPRQAIYAGGGRAPYGAAQYSGGGTIGGAGGGPRSVFVNGPAGVVQGAARAAPNLALSPIGTVGGQPTVNGVVTQQAHALLGQRVGITEFGSDGYNSQGGGPVPEGAALDCNFEGEPCCWANVPTPSDDQIDWLVVNGRPESAQFRNVSMEGKYLVAFANGAAPSDEAQLSSCAIACASSPIRVRARHWQSYNVLLQVCQRESFPPSLGFNPLLNCQEFPSSSRVAHTELVLPKASYVDIVFVASNFIDERGDIVFLDDIEVLYESLPPECGGAVSSTITTTTTTITKSSTSVPTRTKTTMAPITKPKQQPGKEVKKQGNNNKLPRFEPRTATAITTTNLPPAIVVDRNSGEDSGEGGDEGGDGIRRAGANGGSGGELTGGAGTSGGGATAAVMGSKSGGGVGGAGETESLVDGGGGEVSGQSSIDNGGGEGGGSHARAHGVTGKGTGGASFGGIKKSSSSSSFSSLKALYVKSSPSPLLTLSSMPPPSMQHKHLLINSVQACQSIRCSFEDGTSCAYSDTIMETESAVRGLTTRFEVVKGQFMNRVTGVKEGTEGNYYAAVFLYPREKAGLWAKVVEHNNDDNNEEQQNEDEGSTTISGSSKMRSSRDGILGEDTRIRFQYYEGTHGVQLKGCCASSGAANEEEWERRGGVEGREELICPFQSDRFVTVEDRMWKMGSFVCPTGTAKVIFLCENTRTNQGACAIDDIAVVENGGNGADLRERRTIC